MGEKLESEKRWHSETLLKLNEAEDSLSQQGNKSADVDTANSDVALLQDKLSSKNSEIAQLAAEKEELQQQMSEPLADKSDSLQEEVTELKGQSEESQIAEASQSTDKKFTSI